MTDEPVRLSLKLPERIAEMLREQAHYHHMSRTAWIAALIEAEQESTRRSKKRG